MKKIVSIILAVMLVLGMSTSAFAAGKKTYEYGIYDRKAGWWYDEGDPMGYYNFDDKEMSDVLYTYAETMSKAEGLAALYRLIGALQNRGMYLKNYTVHIERTANHVYEIEAVNQYGQTWECYFSIYTHKSAEEIMAEMLAGTKIEYFAIFLTTYVKGQKIADYDDMEKITGFDKSIDDAIYEFIYKLENYDSCYPYYYGYDYYDPYYYDDGNG